MPILQLGAGIRQVLSSNKTSVVATSLVIGTAILDAVTNVIFECPCVTEAQAMAACGNHSSITKFCVPQRTKDLCCLQIFAPIFLFLVLSCLAAFTWHVCVLHWKADDKSKCCCCQCSDIKHLCRGFLVTILAPLTWVAMMFMDGEYFACLRTPLPYNFNDGKCTISEKSEEYKSQRAISKIIGLSMILGTSGLSFIFFLASQGCQKKTFHEQKYERLYQELEDEYHRKLFETKSKEGFEDVSYPNNSLKTTLKRISEEKKRAENLIPKTKNDNENHGYDHENDGNASASLTFEQIALRGKENQGQGYTDMPPGDTQTTSETSSASTSFPVAKMVKQLKMNHL